MSATIKFHDRLDSDRSTESSPKRPRQLICNIWSLQGSEVGDAVFVNQPISSAASRSSAPSQLELPGAGAYLVEVVHPGGRRSRRTVDLAKFAQVRFELPSQVVTPKQFHSSGSSIKSSAARVAMSAVKQEAESIEVEICAIAPLASPGGLMNPRVFVAGVLSCRHKGYKVAKFPTTVGSFDVNPREAAPPRHQPTSRRSWLLARGGGGNWTLIAYPEAWTDVDGEVPLRVSATPPCRASTNAQWSISLGLFDSAYGSLLEFLSNRDWSSAWATYSAIPNLQAPNANHNPYSMAVTAYALALAQEEAGDTKLDDTPEFYLLAKDEWLPDIAIALAWRILRQAESCSEMFQDARHLILRAVDQGFPCFAIGLRVLCDALNYLAVVAPKDEQIAKALGAATRAELACVPGEIFTTIDMARLLALSKKIAT